MHAMYSVNIPRSVGYRQTLLLPRHCGHVEIEERPLVAVQVAETTHVHHAVVERAAQGLCTRGNGVVGEVVDLLCSRPTSRR